jgi:hypothetical protein
MSPQSIKVKCGCGVILSVTNSRNEAVKRFNCPNCGKAIEVPFHKLPADDGETHLGDEPATGDTHLGGNNLQHTSCRLELDGRRYDLLVGRNSVGRKADSSHADVQLYTTDKYMSRQHAIINVRRLPDGSIKCDISNDQNKNATRVNNYTLGPDDAIVLHEGDRITMGDTTVTFHYGK